ncbi:hypothetical protein GCM10007897_09240 [Sphingobium jiangsuense]|uniref:DNA-binding protein n=1 Tax=Sphingobium jiangsuense TaxID=870476 RepID=A0A7W6FQI6_9SPHN|nr:DNA-binding protein [Sphingobium jiangsuense]MBB3927176.1 hypothetical protein [Sphingobium jiangsuense]GLS99544.1 hypothetical protein GCM10007897_09240 [Sphingobium jiangsuense]
MAITGPQARAARALVQWPRDHVAKLARLDEAALAAFEGGQADLDEEERARLIHALEQGGAIFLAEDRKAGAGVRLKFTKRDVRAINRLEGEGGPVGTDDV